MSHREDLGAVAGLAGERISRRRGAVVREPQHLAAQAVRLLRLARVRRRAGRPVEQAVAVERRRATRRRRRRSTTARRRSTPSPRSALVTVETAAAECRHDQALAVGLAVGEVEQPVLARTSGGAPDPVARRAAARRWPALPATGAGSSTPLRMTRSRPGRSVTSMLPSGRNTRFHGFCQPLGHDADLAAWTAFRDIDRSTARRPAARAESPDGGGGPGGARRRGLAAPCRPPGAGGGCAISTATGQHGHRQVPHADSA